jgi:hypothetical protein
MTVCVEGGFACGMTVCGWAQVCVGCWDKFTDIWCKCLGAALSKLATQGPSTSHQFRFANLMLRSG